MGDLNMNALMVPLTLHGSVLVNFLFYFSKMKKLENYLSNMNLL